jgi:SAM-dependent methyltransferase
MDELRQLAAFSGWGAVPQVFDENNAEYAEERRQLRDELNTAEWNAASRSTINAHFTDPAYVQAIWTAMQDLGFTGGRVLEPGCGTGNFIGLAPEGTQLVGVELDEITANIASHLYPDAEILGESFADSRFTGRFDAVVGNVPFAENVLVDRVHNAGRHSMHNHFLIKSLALTKPGGIVAALTSRYTLDSQNPAARRELAELGDLVGAVRLPSGAHRRTAGTDVVTDLVLLRRREPDREPDPDTLRWLDMTTAVDVDDTTLRINPYFVDHPEQILGELGVASSMYGSDSLVVRGDRAAGPALSAALDRIVTAAADRDLRWSATGGDEVVIRPAAQIGAAPDQFIGHITQTGPDDFVAIGVTGELEALKVPRTQARELGHLLQLRDAITALLQAEAASLEDTTEISQLRDRLNRSYDSYQTAYGPLNRFTEKGTGKYDDQGNESISRTRPGVMRIFAGDPFAAMVHALEIFDAERQTAAKADVLSQRVVAPRRPVLGADSPADALAISIDTYGEPRLEEIASLLGIDEAEARTALQGLVFEDPANQRLVSSAEYLSGNVRIKLAAAITAAAEDDRYTENVGALRAVIPEDVPPGTIVAQLGAAWIGPDDVQTFLREILGDRHIEVRRIVGSQWKVEGGNFGVNATSEWGTARFPAGRLADHVLRQAPVRVLDKLENGGEILNYDETTAAEEKAKALKERFSEWVWEDPARADRLARVYNDAFNAIVLRSYDTDHMSLPGLVETWTPRPHQFAAVARMIAEPTVGLFHEVGAGKTAEMVMGVMEQRRLGLVNKPAIVVPNHMLGQFSREFLQLYPQARILAAGTADLVESKRRAFVARATTGNWDAIIMTRTLSRSCR